MRRNRSLSLLLMLACGASSALVLSAGRAEGGDGVPIKEPSRKWRQVDGKYWQVEGPEGEAPEVTDAAEGNRGSCPAGMVDVKGNYHATPGEGDLLQQSTCSKWINRDFPERCAEFDKAKWHAELAKFPTKAMHFCIDRFEYPNRKGAYPIITVDWVEAGALCRAQKTKAPDGTAGTKRLCTEVEWTFACEGDDAAPYPYGYVRDKSACLVDKTWRQFFGGFLRGNPVKTAMLELDYLWQGVPSGSMPRCKSVFGVYDMTGNVDEWTESSYGGRKSILKGGYWGPVRTRCRPSTRAHGENHVFYQQGFRCCAEAH